jgi:hypothetical protein
LREQIKGMIDVGVGTVLWRGFFPLVWTFDTQRLEMRGDTSYRLAGFTG